MYIKKEQYREFEGAPLWCYKEGDETPKEVEKGVDKNENKTPQKELDPSAEILKHKNRVHEAINKIEAKLPEPEKQIAQVALKNLREHVDDRFDEIYKEYQEAIQKGVVNYEGSREERRINRKAERLADKIINRKLNDKDAIKSIVQEFLEEVPNPDSKGEEKDLVQNWISENSELESYFGPEEKNKQRDKVVDLLSQKYDIHFDEDGKPLYAFDLMSGEVIDSEGPDNLKDRILGELKEGPLRQKDLDEYEDKIWEGTKELRNYRKEVSKNKVTLRAGGKVDTWKELFENTHPGMKKLREKYAAMEPKIEEMVDAKKTRAFEQAQKEKHKDELNEHQTILTEAGYEEKISQLKSQGYRVLDQSKADFENQFADQVTLEGSGDNPPKISIKVEDGMVELSLKNQIPYFETTEQFSNPEDFKAVDITKKIQEKTGNYLRNIETDAKFSSVLSKLDLPGVEIEKVMYGHNEMTSTDFKLQPATLMMDGYYVGAIHSLGNDQFKIEIKGAENPTETTSEKLPEVTKKMAKEMRKIVEKSESRKKELALYASDLNRIGTLEGLTLDIKSTDEIESDFTDPSQKVLLAEVKRADGSIAGEISVSGEKYLFEGGDGELKTYDFPEEIKANLEANREAWAKVPERFDELTEPDLKNKEIVRNKLTDGFFKYSPELKDSRVIQNYMTLLTNELYLNNELFDKILKAKNISELLKEKGISESFNQIHRKILFREAEIERLEKPNEDEMKIISELSITIGGEEKNFKDVFGEEIVQVLSMTLDVQMKDPGGLCLVNGDQITSIKPVDLIEKLPKGMRTDCQKILNGEELNMSGFKLANKIQVGALASFQTLTETVDSPEFKASQEKLPKKAGILSLIKAIALVAQMIKDGDYDAAMDAWNHKENLNDTIDQSKKIYERVIQKADLKTLVAVHENPQGDEAKVMLPGEFEKTPFRGMLKQVAQERLQKIMGAGVAISKWEKDKVEFTRFGKSYEMYLDATPGLETFHLRESKEGAPSTPYQIQDGVTGPGRTLENVFAQAIGRNTVSANPTPPTDQPQG